MPSETLVSTFLILSRFTTNDILLAKASFSAGIFHTPGEFEGYPSICVMPLSNIYLMKIGAVGNRRELVITHREPNIGCLTLNITMVHIELLGMGVGLVDCAAILWTQRREQIVHF
ncbi:MAG: hypothetical protein WCF90_00710 [Methanomicrobiales archaeon]